MKHSKGKWIVNGTIIQDEQGYTIAQIWPDTRLPSAKSIMQMQGNAALIAAAPELLAACENALFSLGIISMPQIDENVASNDEILAIMADSFRKAIETATTN